MGRKSELATAVWKGMTPLFGVWKGRLLGFGASRGMTPGEMRALGTLETDEPQPMRALAEAWQCDPSNVTVLIDRLEQRGLVRRRVSDTDRRVKEIVVTPRGVTLQDEIRCQLFGPPKALLALTVPELETLLALLDKVARSLEATGEAEPVATPQHPVATP